MGFGWLIILCIFGYVQGWAEVSPLFWWLLIVFFSQDLHDIRRR